MYEKYYERFDTLKIDVIPATTYFMRVIVNDEKHLLEILKRLGIDWGLYYGDTWMIGKWE
jgi:hypothetical protein